MRTTLILLLTALLPGCTGLFFLPQNEMIDNPKRYGIDYQEQSIQTVDGTVINAWFMPSKGKTKATVLFLHGNAENISTHFRSIMWMPAEGFNVLAIDYRGYGSSKGIPTLEGIQLDLDAAMHDLLAHEGVDPKRIIVLGQSLGGAIAIYFVAHSIYHENVCAIISDSAFFDYREIAREKLADSIITWPFQWLPWLLVDNDYSPAGSVARLSPTPLLLIHGTQDKVVPPHHSQQLFERAGKPKELLLVPMTGHTASLNNVKIRSKLIEFLAQNNCS